MKYLKIYDTFTEDELLINVTDFLNIKYWLIQELDPICWKIEKISENKYSLIILHISLHSNQIQSSIISLNTLHVLLKYAKNILAKYRPLTKEEIEEFEFYIQANQYNL